MALIGYTITVVAKQDNPYNVLPETDISIRKNSDNTLVNIYADEAGLIPIAQLGAKTDSNGQFTFYADASLGILKAVWTNGGVIATEVLDKSDHSRLANLNAPGAHDAISPREFADVPSMQLYTRPVVGLKFSTGGTKWIVTSDFTTTTMQLGLYAKPLTPVRLNDYAIDGVDDSASILSAAEAAQDGGVGSVWADNTVQIGVTDTVDLRTVSDVTLDFNFSSFIDNVQGFLPAGGASRAKPTFIIYNNKSCKIKNISWSVHPSRATNSSSSVPDILVWVGGQYLGTSPTVDPEVSGIVFNGTVLGNMPVCVFGECRGFKSENVDVYGDASYGINFEYGLQPDDPSSNETMSNGKHPYNAKVSNFNGWELRNSRGFLRVASCYNVLFENCQGYNTQSFIHVYGGDRNISRFSENVKFLNCKSKLSNTLFTTVNNAVTILFVNKDGSTGAELPSWTNYDHTVLFEGCEFQNNFAINSSCVRFIGNQGKTLFKGCIFRGSYLGLNNTPSTNPDYVSKDSLKFEDCEFIDNYQDVKQVSSEGVVFVDTKFKDQAAASTLHQVEHITGGATKRTKYIRCNFTGQPADRPYVSLSSFSTLDVFDDCEFEMLGASHAIANTNVVYGNNRNRASNGLVVSTANTVNRMDGQAETESKSTSGLSGATLSYNIAKNWFVNSVLVLDGVVGSPKNGDKVTFRGATGGSSVTFNYNIGGTGRFLNKSGVTDVASGNNWSKSFIYNVGVWYEL